MWAILAKDLRLELRTREGWISLFMLGFLVLLVFQFALPEEPTAESAAAALWLAFLLAGTLGVQRTLLLERENECLTGLLTAPLEPAAIYLAKAAGNFVSLTLLQFSVVPLVVLFFAPADAGFPFALPLVLALGNAGFSAVATLFAAVAVETRAREVMLPLLLFPLLAPLLIAAVESSAILLGGGSLADALVWIQVLAAFDVVFGVAGWLLFEYVVRE